MSQMSTKQSVTEVLNKQISNFSILYVKLHNYHWYVKGEGFFELHTKFEEFYTEFATYIDELAERILAIQGNPVATMRDFLQQSSITEAKGNENAGQMVQEIANNFTILINEIKAGVEVAEQANDGPTADMLTHIQTNLEKHLWMLQAFLRK